MPHGQVEIALHQEAARITDLMLSAGRRLVADAVATGGEFPSEAELAALLSELEGMSDEEARALTAGAGEG